MKKSYIRPESQLFAINLSENIAKSGAETVAGLLHIQWSGGVAYYTNVNNAQVITALSDGDYMGEFKRYMMELDTWDLLNCLW